MPKEKKTFNAESGTAKTLKLQPRQSRDEGTGMQSVYRDAKGDNQFSREMILRLIDWFKQE
ncbi:MAG: hypothetical protein PVF74_01945 [Anaerolineales bacterium]|jgi:hypothetical protein